MILMIENDIANILVEKKLTLSIAESFTGGSITYKITNVPNSSKFLLLSIIPYSNKIKINLLKVKKETILKYGAVSSETVSEMASSIKKISGADIGLSTTGIAGPTGGTKEKPIGTMFLGIAYKDKIETNKYLLKGDRKTIKKTAADIALKYLKQKIS